MEKQGGRWKRSLKKFFAILVITCISISILTIPASASIVYDASFSYYLLDKATGQYNYVSGSSYRAISHRSYPYDEEITQIVGPEYAPAALQNQGYTYTYTYSRTDDKDWLSGDTYNYNVIYHYQPASFTVTYQIDGNSYQTQNCYYQDTVSVLPPAPAKTGYTFSGWTSGDVVLTNGSFTMPAKNVTVQGSYLVHSNTVKYQYTGTIPKKNAPSLPAASAHNYDTTVYVASPPSAPGYTFSGWTSSNVALTGRSFFAMPDNSVTITGTWVPRTDTPYTVEYYQQDINDDDYALTDTEHCTGTTDTMAIVPEKSYPGFTMTSNSVTASTNTNIDGDGSTVLKLYYNRNVSTVTYTYVGETDETPPALPTETTYRYGQAVTLATAPTLPGYIFDGWETSDVEVSEGKFIMSDGPVAITGNWVPRTDTPYTVEYFQQNIDDDNYTQVPADTVAGTGTTGATITGAGKTYRGFTMTVASAAALANTKIHSTGDTALKLYYDRNVNTVTYAYSGDTDVTPQALPATATYRYGQTVTLASVPTLAGYDFGGWETSDATVVDGSFAMPDGPVTLTGTWVPRSDTAFVVEYYQQNLADHDYTKVTTDTYTGVGTTGAAIPLTHKDYEGFTETGPSAAAETATKIASNGSTVLKLYYDRNSYAVSYAYTSAHVDGEPACPAEQQYQYGATVTVEQNPSELAGYHFDGWSYTGVSLSSGTFTMPAKTVAFTGAWIPNSDTPYVVEYYQQNLWDDDYSRVGDDTVNGHGTTRAAIPEAEKTYPGFSMTAASAAEAGTTVIAPDGSTVLKLYYDRNSYTVTYVYAGDTPSEAAALPAAATYKFGKKVTLALVPEAKDGKNISKWTSPDVNLATTFSMPGNNVTITGTWVALPPGDNENPQIYTATLVSDHTEEANLVPNEKNQITFPEGPTKDGYTFVGWSESDGGDVEHQSGDTMTLKKSMTFYAVYTKKIGAFVYGFRDGMFRPEDALTTYQAQLMLARLTGTIEPDNTSSTQNEISRKGFLTMVAQKTATKLINNDVMATAAEEGWILGFADGSLRENTYVTRAQAVIILNRAFNRSDVQPDNAISYTDLPKGYWAHDQIVAASTKTTK